MGQKKCCVCEERSLDFPDRTFFKVPSQEKLRDKFIAWKKFIGEPYYTDSVEIYICESHFEDSYIIQGKSRKLLSVGAIPTIVTRNQEIATVLNRFVPENSKPKQKLFFFLTLHNGNIWSFVFGKSKFLGFKIMSNKQPK